MRNFMVIGMSICLCGIGSGCARTNAGEPQAAQPSAASSVSPVAAAELRGETEGRNRTEFKETKALSMSQKPITLCQVARMLSGPGGVYRIDQLIGVTENGLGEHSGEVGGVTYVSMTLLEDWGQGAPTNPTARINGGPVDDKGTVQAWFVSLRQGDVVGLLLGPPTAANKGFYSIHNLGVFAQSSSGGVSNGQLFTRSRRALSEVGAYVRRIRAGGPDACAADVEPDAEIVHAPVKGGPDIIVTPAVPLEKD